MEEENIYITINHLDDFNSVYRLRPGDALALKKDKDNPYDDEAIVVYGRHGGRCGYVANSVSSVARGTHSSGRLYDKMGSEAKCIVCFVTEDCVIGRIVRN